MNTTQREALQYVKNTGGGATPEAFKEDWEPIGEHLWNDLKSLNAVYVDSDGKIYITPTGQSLLSA